MALLRSLLTALHAPLKRFITAWGEARLIEPAPEELAQTLDPACPTLYVLPHPALSDALLLDVLCQRYGLPSARSRIQLGDVELPAYVALPTQQRRLWRRNRPRLAPFHQALTYLAQHDDANIQAIPVGIFWGRAPGKRFGFWHLLAADSWQLTGRLRRALSVLINGKSVEVHFGAPLQLRDLLDERGPAVANRKGARLLRVHFRRMRRSEEHTSELQSRPHLV